MDPVDQIVDGIWNDINGRSGMDLDILDEETQDDIRDSWTRIVERVFREESDQ